MAVTETSDIRRKGADKALKGGDLTDLMNSTSLSTDPLSRTQNKPLHAQFGDRAMTNGFGDQPQKDGKLNDFYAQMGESAIENGTQAGVAAKIIKERRKRNENFFFWWLRNNQEQPDNLIDDDDTYGRYHRYGKRLRADTGRRMGKKAGDADAQKTKKAGAEPDAQKTKFNKEDPHARAAQKAIDKANKDTQKTNRKIQDLEDTKHKLVTLKDKPTSVFLQGDVAKTKPDIAAEIDDAMSKGQTRKAARLANKAMVGEWNALNKTRRSFTGAQIREWNTELRDLADFARNRNDVGYKTVKRQLNGIDKDLDAVLKKEAKQAANQIRTMIRSGQHIDILGDIDLNRLDLMKDPFMGVLHDYAATPDGKTPSQRQILKDLEAKGAARTDISRRALIDSLGQYQDRLYDAQKTPVTPTEDFDKQAGVNVDNITADADPAPSVKPVKPAHPVTPGGDIDAQNGVDIDRITADADPAPTVKPAKPAHPVTPGGDIDAQNGVDIDRITADADPAPTVKPAKPARAQTGPTDLSADFDRSTGNTPAPAVSDPAPAPTRIDQLQTNKWGDFLESRGSSVDAFNQATTPAAAHVPDMDNVNMPDMSRVNLPTAAAGRAGRFFRMATPNGLDIVIAGGIGAAVGVYTGKATLGNDADVKFGAVGYDINEKAGALAAGESLILVDTAIAASQGRTNEAVIRGAVNVVEIASPFAVAAAGAGIGAAAFSWTGPGAAVAAAVGGAIGGVVGWVTSGAITIAFDEGIRATAHGLGFEDVDRGMIGSFFAPEYAEEMEAWIRQVGKGQDFEDGKSVNDIMNSVVEDADTPQEKTKRFREFLDIADKGYEAKQKELRNKLAETLAKDGIQNVENALKNPEARAQIIAFYQQQLADDPGNEAAQNTLNDLTSFEEVSMKRLEIVAAKTNADIMDSMQLQQDTSELMEEFGDEFDSFFSYRGMSEFDDINLQNRIEALQERIEGLQETNADTGAIMRKVFEGTDPHAAMGTTQIIADSMNIICDLEDAILAKQQSFIDNNWGKMQPYMSGSVMNRYIEEVLGDADNETDKAFADELKELMEETDNMQNVNKAQALRLMNNRLFREALDDAMDDRRGSGRRRNRDTLGRALNDADFDQRAEALEQVRAHKQRMEQLLKVNGFDMKLDPNPQLSPEQAARINPELAPQIH
ncbi:MAG: hypothetical protein H6869_08555 [Rhodospirillales bacterium]|nr:hypothetical protein [Rhodospirillales bacterium]